MNQIRKLFTMPGSALLALGCLMILLAACGQTGPLYLEDKSPQETPVDADTVSEEAPEQTSEDDEQAH